MRRPVVSLGLLAIALTGLARWTFVVVRVDGASMLPTYADGDRLLAIRSPATRAARPGDVVVVMAPAPGRTSGGELLVKRVARVERGPSGSRLFVVGDNAPSYDSSTFGPLPTDAVVGRVIRVLATR